MTTDTKLTLFHAPNTRSTGALTLLYELGADFDLRVLNFKAAEQRAPAYLAVNPMGKVPAIRHGDALVTEQGAVFLYLADLYPEAEFASTSGSVSGRVTKEGQPIFGAHIVAFDVARGTSVGSFTLTADGRFSIGSMTPGIYILRAEPIDDADVDSFFDPGRNTDIDFRVVFADRVVVVPKAGDSGDVAVAVVRK